jgi:integrase
MLIATGVAIKEIQSSGLWRNAHLASGLRLGEALSLRWAEAYRKARTRLPARSSARGAGRRVRSAVGECLLGRPEDQRGARTACGQG